jgi:acetyl-CoA C-acetyltransferase
MTQLRDAVICSPVRTPVGKYGGVFRDVTATALAATAISALIDRTRVPVERIDDVQLGQCYPNGEAPAIGRVAALDAGLPVDVPGMQVDRRCGSGLQAVLNAAMQVQTGVSDLILAGGAESMSQAEFYTLDARWGVRGAGTMLHDRLSRGRVMSGGTNYPVPGGMIETAENLRQEYGISREEQDVYALRSHQRAVAAQQRGDFDDEIVGVEIHDREGSHEVLRDETPRDNLTAEKLASLPPVMASQDPHATVTAGNASAQNDGASVCMVTTRELADQFGLEPLARIVSWSVAGVPPRTMGIGPVPATQQALERAGLTMNDMDAIELNEAFAAQVLACTREWGFGADDFDRMNVNGSGISLGHPVGATGCRIMTSMLRDMKRRDLRYGLETMCLGGGQGLAAVFERIV